MARFPFTMIPSQPGSSMPRLPLELSIGHRSIHMPGLIDTGSAINVLPYPAGASLGATWDNLPDLGLLAGGLAGVETKALAVTCRISGLTQESAITLHFAWARLDSVPLLLGQADFLDKFNVCFYRSERYFDVWRA